VSGAVSGAIRIAIAKSDTALDPTRYTDALQVVAGTNKDVFWTGQILVAANPFNVWNWLSDRGRLLLDLKAPCGGFFIFSLCLFVVG
jgi:hypothetical protein